MWLVQVRGMAEKLGVHINWKGRRDHMDPILQEYQVCPPIPVHNLPFSSAVAVYVPVQASSEECHAEQQNATCIRWDA